MNIPFVDLKIQYLNIKSESDNAIFSGIEETAFIKGRFVTNFEKEFADIYGAKHCVSVANGTDSIYVILKMLGIKEGDEVITVANSWISTSETISQTGATPVFIDTDEYFTIDVTKIEEKITSKTKAIIPVHMYGQMADVIKVEEICKKHNLYMVEDCAQSHFSELEGIRAGLRGVAASFSFFPGKNLGAYGDAGCILSNNDDLADKFRMYANHGALIKHQHKIEGINSRLDGLQAAILSVKLKYIIEWTQKRIAVADLYSELLSDVNNVSLPLRRANSKHSYHLYVIKAESRDELRAFLQDNGIACEIHYPTPLPFLAAYKYLNCNPEDYPTVLENQSKILSLPVYPEISKEQITYIVNKIKEFYNK